MLAAALEDTEDETVFRSTSGYMYINGGTTTYGVDLQAPVITGVQALWEELAERADAGEGVVVLEATPPSSPRMQ